MATKRVRVKQNDPGETTKAQIVTGMEGGLPQFGPHEKREDRVIIPEGTQLDVVDPPVRGSGTSALDYYYIADTPFNKTFRRYFIKRLDTV